MQELHCTITGSNTSRQSDRQTLQHDNQDSEKSRTWREPSTEAFRYLSQQLEVSNEDAAFWWQVTGSALAVMLEEAGYDMDAQHQHLQFYHDVITPRLGPRPLEDGSVRGWKSFMTDDFSPIEYSFNWDAGLEEPRVRYSVEPIGPNAGTDTDAYNQLMTKELASHLRRLFPNSKWTTCDYFTDALQVRSPAQRETTALYSSPMVAFELGKGAPAMKAYFMHFEPSITGPNLLDIVCNSIQNAGLENLDFGSLERWRHFMTFHPEGSLLSIIGLAIDCVENTKSRVKVYVRSPHTSFNSVCEILSMGGTSFTTGLKEELWSLWSLVLSLDDAFPRSCELPLEHHETAGVLYYFDLSPGNRSKLEAKVYIPVKHYGKNDLEIAHGLGTYLRRQGKDQYFLNYMRMLEGICTHRTLESDRGLQTYISCSIKKKGLALTSYISREVYYNAR